MTAVLSPTDALRKNKLISLDDNQLDYSTSSTDWRVKYNEVADMLAETRAELDDFHHASKELEAELENELQRTEKAQQELQLKIIRAESERDEWKSKFMSLQTNHNTTTASLQRELDKLRQEYQHAKIQLRDLEMGNDDLERNERAVSSSLADMEARYSRALEEKILLEHELIEKASLEEESQRLRDELRDANVEISILKSQIKSQATTDSNAPPTKASSPPPTDFPRLLVPSDDDLLHTTLPPDLQLNELSPTSESLSLEHTPEATPQRPAQSTLLHAGFDPTKSRIRTSSSVTRSATLPSLHTSSPRTVTRPLTKPNNTITSTSTTSTTSKSKGVQMVSEMRARVRNLEQKIHTRVPRLRMGSITGRSSSSSFTLAGLTSNMASSSSSKTSTAKTSWDGFSQRRSGDSRQSNDSGSEKNRKDSGGDSSGWVLIMEDSPPSKENDRERRRVSSPSNRQVLFRPAASTSTSLKSPTFSSGKPNTFGQSTATPNAGIRRPQSRLSVGSMSTTTTSSIPTPISRPTTPNFLYVHSSNSGIPGMKRSTGPSGPNPYSQSKNAYASSDSGISPSARARPTTMPPLSRPASGTPSSGTKHHDSSKALPQLPSLHANVTIRPASKPSHPGNGTLNLSQSRIGRPSGAGLSGRRSTDGTASPLMLNPEFRTRSGSTSTPPS